MGIHLGINDDYWHGILAFVGNLVGFQICYWLFFKFGNLPLRIIVSIFTAALFMWCLQLFNEMYQELHWQGNYQSIEHFRENSRKDWRYFYYGSFFAITLNGIIGGLMS